MEREGDGVMGIPDKIADSKCRYYNPLMATKFEG
jgi:hypothetical protein